MHCIVSFINTQLKLNLPYFLIWFPPTNSFLPWIVSAPLFTVTFGFPNSKKNCFRGNYMRKYGIFYPRCIIGSYHNCLSVALACGASASENQTYLVQASVTTLTNPCKYTICPCGTNICRIRFDFTVINLKRPSQFLF